MERGRTTLIATCLLVLLAGRNGYGQFSAFAHVTYETQQQYGLEVRILSVDGQDDKYKVILPDVSGRFGPMAGYLIVCSDPVPPEKQDFRPYVLNEDRERDDVLLMAPLWSRAYSLPVWASHVEVILDDFLMTKSYIYLDYPRPVDDGGYYYCIDLSTYPLPEVRRARVRYSPAIGLGPESRVMRRDPSDIIRTREFSYVGDYLKTSDTYYVWYTRSILARNEDAMIWYATSPDGHAWTEKGEVLPRGPEGSWDAQSVFTPNILVAKNKYYLFYTGVPKPFPNEGNRVTKTAIGIAVADSPDGPWMKLEVNPVLTCGDKEFGFDSVRVDDACLIVRDGKYWLYYKGRRWDDTPANTKMGVAVAEKPEGPYVKYGGNPVIKGGHEVLVWPVGAGVVAMVGAGPAGIRRTLQYAPDGLTFSKLQELDTVPLAPGAYRPQAFRDKGNGEMIEWGLHTSAEGDSLPFLERFDCQW